MTCAQSVRVFLLCMAALGGPLACFDPADGATVLDLTLELADGVALEQVEVALELDDGTEFAPFSVPDPPRPLERKEELEVLLPDDAGGHRLAVVVTGGDARGQGSVDVKTGARNAVTVQLAVPVEPPAGECGDGVLDDGESCDDQGTASGDGCDDECAMEAGWVCSGEPSVCNQTCGDGVLDDGEQCDDEGAETGDGCDGSCQVEPGWQCSGAPSVCSATCGDGVLDDGEGCDDDDNDNGDGCDPSCQVEAGWACDGAPSVCSQTCNNGALDVGEQCDDGGLTDGDGCTASCQLEPGFACDPPGTACTPVCGDALVRASEGCDDGGAETGDGCDGSCAREPGYICSGEPSACTPGCTIDGGDVVEGTLDPSNACRACQPAIDPLAYSARPDDTPCDDGLFCDGADACVGGACVAGTISPCTAPEQPLCIEPADLCSCAGSSCDNGVFCDGAESCEVDGSCAPGAPPVCSAPTGVCSDAIEGCVECVDDGDCAPPNASCFVASNTCTACPGCPCPSGFHDGGDGTCVADDSCSPGYARPFVDGDLDGIGAGAQSSTCTAYPFAPGLSLTGTDCDDTDDTLFELQDLFADFDLDGYTVAPAAPFCVGFVLPATLKTVANPPPRTSFEPANGVELSGPGVIDWSDETHVRFRDTSEADAYLDNNGDYTDPLEIREFDPRVPTGASILGVVVHMRRRVVSASAGSAVDRTVQLFDGTTASQNRASATQWTTTNDDVSYGGPTDTWGLALTPALVNAATFAVRLEVGTTAGANNVDIEVDHVWIEVFIDSGSDCDDANSAVWTVRPSFSDGDGDHFGVGTESDRCMGTLMLTNVAERAGDCYDNNANARPGQTTYYSSNRGDGSFDYNCDTALTKQSVTQATACTCSVTPACVATNSTYTPSANCGSSTSSDTCVDSTCSTGGGGCTLTQGTTTTRCR